MYQIDNVLGWKNRALQSIHPSIHPPVWSLVRPPHHSVRRFGSSRGLGRPGRFSPSRIMRTCRYVPCQIDRYTALRSGGNTVRRWHRRFFSRASKGPDKNRPPSCVRDEFLSSPMKQVADNASQRLCSSCLPVGANARGQLTSAAGKQAGFGVWSYV